MHLLLIIVRLFSLNFYLELDESKKEKLLNAINYQLEIVKQQN